MKQCLAIGLLLLGACTDALIPNKLDIGRRPGGVAVASSKQSDDKPQRQPWNFFRFVRQSSRFVIPGAKTPKQNVQPGDTLWNVCSSNGNNDFGFAPLDDVVMGGASSSFFDGATGKWKGQVTDANNGGFVGIRSTPNLDYDMSNCKGIEIKLSSVPRRLKVVIRDSTEFNGIGWNTIQKVEGKGSWIRIPFNNQVPTMFAKKVPDQTFSKGTIKGIQLVYSKFEYDGELNPTFQTGDFEVQVEEIRAF